MNLAVGLKLSLKFRNHWAQVFRWGSSFLPCSEKKSVASGAEIGRAK